MEVIRGIGVSPGVAIGRVFVLDDQRVRIPRREVPRATVPAEQRRLGDAIQASIDELRAVQREAEAEMGADAARVFLFHVSMLLDETLVEPMRRMIADECVTAEYAVYRTFSDWAETFAQKHDTTFTTKVNDLLDLSARILRHLIGEHGSRLGALDVEAIVVAEDLTPSQAAGFDRSKVVAFATDLGGRTSHTAIVARALGIPAVVGCRVLTELVADGTSIIVDGDRGVVTVEPDADKLEEYSAYLRQREAAQISLADVSRLPAVTRDSVEVELLGNIEFPEEVTKVLEAGGAGVGLYRTEFLYLASKAVPTEADHDRAYRTCVELLAGRPLTIRTLDLGADKYTQERAATPERNPFLGCRSIRLSLQCLTTFRQQLRAILRASGLGPVNVMFPLVTTLSELRQAKWLLHEAMEDLADEGTPFDEGIEVGMMVEAPSAALMAGTFAREVDFFSIGTNDLVQYTLAVDRTNERVAGLFNPAHPAVIRLIREVARVGRRAGIPVSVCGESAAEPEFALLLLGLGVRTLSVTSSAIPQLKRLVRATSMEQCERIARRAVSLDSEVEVAGLLRDQARKIIP
jgi:phosphotransferase system enzyme I (PtsI)